MKRCQTYVYFRQPLTIINPETVERQSSGSMSLTWSWDRGQPPSLISCCSRGEMQLKAALEDESDDKTEGTTVTYNYTAHLMKCRKLPHQPDTNNIIILGIGLPISVATYRDTCKPPIGICKCPGMGLVQALWANTSSGSGRSVALCR